MMRRSSVQNLIQNGTRNAVSGYFSQDTRCKRRNTHREEETSRKRGKMRLNISVSCVRATQPPQKTTAPLLAPRPAQPSNHPHHDATTSHHSRAYSSILRSSHSHTERWERRLDSTSKIASPHCSHATYLSKQSAIAMLC